MALGDLIPHALRAAKPVGGHGDSSPRVSGVADDAIVPVPDHIKGDVLPYRGTETHGVEAGDVTYVDPRGELRKSVDVHLDPPTHPVTPVLVKVVKTDATEYTDWRVVSTLASGIPISILNRNRNRTRTFIYNNSGVAIFVGSNAMMSTLNGYPISAYAQLEIHHTEDVWVMSSDGSNVDVRAYFEFRRG